MLCPASELEASGSSHELPAPETPWGWVSCGKTAFVTVALSLSSPSPLPLLSPIEITDFITLNTGLRWH